MFGAAYNYWYSGIEIAARETERGLSWGRWIQTIDESGVSEPGRSNANLIEGQTYRWDASTYVVGYSCRNVTRQQPGPTKSEVVIMCNHPERRVRADGHLSVLTNEWRSFDSEPFAQ